MVLRAICRKNHHQNNSMTTETAAAAAAAAADGAAFILPLEIEEPTTTDFNSIITTAAILSFSDDYDDDESKLINPLVGGNMGCERSGKDSFNTNNNNIITICFNNIASIRASSWCSIVVVLFVVAVIVSLSQIPSRISFLDHHLNDILIDLFVYLCEHYWRRRQQSGYNKYISYTTSLHIIIGHSTNELETGLNKICKELHCAKMSIKNVNQHIQHDEQHLRNCTALILEDINYQKLANITEENKSIILCLPQVVKTDGVHRVCTGY